MAGLLMPYILNTFIFEDYMKEKLAQIGLGNQHEQKYEIDDKAYSVIYAGKV